MGNFQLLTHDLYKIREIYNLSKIFEKINICSVSKSHEEKAGKIPRYQVYKIVMIFIKRQLKSTMGMYGVVTNS